MIQSSLQLALALIVIRPDERGEQTGTLHSDLQKALTNLCFRKQSATLANFMLCHQKIFVPQEFRH